MKHRIAKEAKVSCLLQQSQMTIREVLMQGPSAKLGAHLCVSAEDCLQVCIQLACSIGAVLIRLLTSAAAQVVKGHC